MKVSRIVNPLALCLVALAPSLARADDPKYDFAAKEDIKNVVWKASAQIGAFGSTGNAQTVTVNGALNLSRNDGKNKFTLDTLGAYSQAWLRATGPVDTTGSGVITQQELNNVQNRTATESAANWLFKGRYDRFFTNKNAGYLIGFVGQDYVVQKNVLTGGQVGYSRLLLKSEMNELAAEVGYDILYTHYQPIAMSPSTLIHSARFFLGYLLTLRKDTAINASMEAFINGNTIDVGPAGDPNTHKTFGEASRVIGKLGLTTVIYKKISFKFGVTLKYDNAPSPVAVTLPNTGPGATPAMYAPGIVLLRNDKVDFIGEAAIVVSFL